MVYASVLETIGSTPLVRINRLAPEGSAAIHAKLESSNPGGSVKDRIALSMIKSAEKHGIIKPGDTIVEPAYGNTAVGLAMVAAVKGYRAVFTVPETVSEEYRKILRAFGAELVLVSPKEGQGMAGAVSKAKELAKQNGWLHLQQFNNFANPTAHYDTTAKEIIDEFASAKMRLDAFVAGVGTGGTITGAGMRLKEWDEAVRIVAVEPKGSAVLSGGKPGPHRIEGIGAGFKPDVLDASLIDEIVAVSDRDAMAAARDLAKREGILAGVSSGAAVWAALAVAKRLGPGKNVVVILPDTGERYLGGELFRKA